jgi:predicted MPP superfamily phosphohydrolase
MRTFLRLWTHMPELLGLAFVVGIQFQFARWVLEAPALRRLRYGVWLTAALAALWVAFGFYANLPANPFPPTWAVYWLRGGGLAWAFCSMLAFFLVLPLRRAPRFGAGRRGFLRAAGGAFITAPFAALGYGTFIERKELTAREVQIAIPNLAADLRGLRLAQLSDIHLSPYLSERELARAVDMANEFRAHIALVTGDLITGRGDPLDACLRQLARLRSDAGVYGCLGNHEVYAHAEEAATIGGARLGIRFLRSQSQQFRFGDATLNMAGVDYQRSGRPYLVGAERFVVPGMTNVLLSHNPDVFDVAARQGYGLTISGHTHGGQITVEILNQSLNVARFYTPYIYGIYRRGPAAVWVTRGIGTVGIPARFGAPPEVALIRLCAT